MTKIEGIPLTDPRVMQLAQAKWPWEGMTTAEQDAALREARTWLVAAMDCWLIDPSKVHLTADAVIIAADAAGVDHLLLIQRALDSDAYPGRWGLPGGYVNPGEETEIAAIRELFEETGIVAPWGMRDAGVYDAPDRDPRGRVVSRAYVGRLAEMVEPVAADDAVQARWWPLDKLPELAFDHGKRIIPAALCVLREGV